MFHFNQSAGVDLKYTSHVSWVLLR